jgi:ABC-2 type transport system permease protein
MSPSELADIADDNINTSMIYWAISDTWMMAKRSITHIIRSMDQLMSAVMFPIMFMLLNKYVLGGAIEVSLREHYPGIEYVNFLFAGVLIQMLAFGANYTTINIAVDMKEGIVDRFRSLPMSNGAFVVGHIFADLVRNYFSSVIVFVVAFVIGFRPKASLGEWLLIIILATLFTLAISWLSAILGFMVKSLEAAQWMGFVIIFPLTFISSAFVDPRTMPSGLRAFANNQPLTVVIDQMREWLVGIPAHHSEWVAYAWCIGIIAFSIPIAATMFRKQTR